jgi:cellulose 1,4-beta-cellobiosidase
MPRNGGDDEAAWGTGYCDAAFTGGAGCPSFNLQDGNSRSMVFRAEPCEHLGWSKTGECASPGCGFNAYKFGLHDFWSRTLNTRSKVTIVTQFVTAGPTLTEIRRIYIQGGRVFRNPTVKVSETHEFSAISDAFCQATSEEWAENDWQSLARLGHSFEAGHVLVFSLSDSNDMGWLDSGVNGPCDNPSKEDIEAEYAEMTVTWSNIRFGDIDTTY